MHKLITAHKKILVLVIFLLITFEVILNKNSTVIRNFTILRERPTCLSAIPCTVWMLWDKGWDKAPPLQKMCLNSFKRHNPHWDIRAISLAEAETLIDRIHFYPNSTWNKARVQAKSDIIRIELLARYGGVWADSTVYCTEPLDNWINPVLGVANFVAYQRIDNRFKLEQNKAENFWIAPWFLATTNTSRIVQIWRDNVREAWNKHFPPGIYGYYWLHKLFMNLSLSNTELQTYLKYVTFMDAGGPHCWPETLPRELRNKTPHVYKAKAPGCINSTIKFN